MIKKLFLTIALMITVLLVNAQKLTQTIRGEITDKYSGVTLPGATVVVLNTSPVVGTSTDGQGKFRFSDIPIGRVSLKVSYVGYADAIFSNLNLTAGKELVVNVQLEELAIPVDAVVVKAESQKERPVNKFSLISARSFTVEETERYAGSRGDVARMAANYAGVFVVDDSRNDIIIRGNSPMGLLWRLEGVDIPNPNHWGVMGTTGGPVCMLNNNLLGNSDFITGAFAAEYGNAISGVFDLKMRNGNNEKYEFLGQIGFNGFELGAEGPINRDKGSSFLVNYRYSTLGVFDKLGIDLGTGVGIPYYQDLSFKVNIPQTKYGNFSVFGLGGLSDIEIWDSRRDTLKDKIDFYGGEGFDLTNVSNMGVIGLNHSYIFNQTTFSNLSLATSAHQYKTVLDSLSTDLSEKFPYYRNNFIETTIYGNFSINKKISAKNQIKFGAIAKWLLYSYADSVYDKNDDLFQMLRNDEGNAWLVQPYLNWQYRPNNALTINSGVHAMYFFLNGGWSVEPRIALRWAITSGSSVNFGYGLHSQVVSLPIMLNRVRLNDNSYIQPNKDLDFIRSHHFVAGYDWLFAPNTRLKVEAYYQHIFDAAVGAMESNSYSFLNEGASFVMILPEYVKSGGTGANYGVELTLERFLSKGYYYLITTSLFQSMYQGSDGVTHSTAFNHRYITNALFGKEFELSNGEESKKILSFDAKVAYSGGKRATPWTAIFNPVDNEYYREWNETRAYDLQLRDYFKTDLSVRFKLNKFGFTQEWAIEVTNLFNSKNIYGDKFNTRTGEAKYVYQLGLMVIPQYRITF